MTINANLKLSKQRLLVAVFGFPPGGNKPLNPKFPLPFNATCARPTVQYNAKIHISKLSGFARHFNFRYFYIITITIGELAATYIIDSYIIAHRQLECI